MKFVPSRRDLLRKAPLSLAGAGLLARIESVAAQQPRAKDTLKSRLRALDAEGRSKQLLLPAAYDGEDQPPSPAKADRLPVAWHRAAVARFRSAIGAHGCADFLLREPDNIIYLLGYFHIPTERPQAGFMGKADQDPFFFYPALDRDTIRGFWFDEGKQYFDYPDNGADPTSGDVRRGAGIDLFEEMLLAIRQRGIHGKKLAIDRALSPAEKTIWKKVLPHVKPVDASDLLMGMRQVKTHEELALWSRAYLYFDRAHAFARDYILAFGTDVTDLEVGVATQFWTNDLLYSELDLAGGAPSHGVLSYAAFDVRCGRTTAYPHPNQPAYRQIERGSSMILEGAVYVGGYGGENYRSLILANEDGSFDPHLQKLWEVSQHCCDIQVEMQTEGTVCSEIAYAIHDYQKANGVQKYIYHRPAHGAGIEGHQSPYLSLGDSTVLKRNMCFSEEPGLYDPEKGCGFNWSDTVVTGVKSGYRMSRVPYDRNWCWIKI